MAHYPANYAQVAPDAAKIEFGEVRRAIIQSGWFSATPVLVWVSLVRVNGKNSYGGYTGFEQWGVAWKDGRIFAYSSDGYSWIYM